MSKRIASIALASALAVGAAAPAPAMAQDSGPNPTDTFVQSAQSLGLGFISNPGGTVLGGIGMLSIMPFILSSWAGFDILPD